ncbi:hypothetical protein CSAL01_03158 [Colletotrichum salicis]|uniref:Integral membrane protein n=1 Tax=Colletotrichum salicis TaxID=1209931 RepID=A0A135STK1_9PEZI|nr:hypothetical protein CSAL01_03158 [Colletotrichum salicis]
MVDDKGPMIIAVCWSFTALGLIFVVGRLFVRATVHQKLFSDDYWIILSSFCAILSNALVITSIGWVNVKHFTALDLEQKQNTVKRRINTIDIDLRLNRTVAPADVCIPTEGLAFWASSFSAFLDFYLAKKLALTCALGMGIISGCAGIVEATGVPTLSSQDVSFGSSEGNLIIIAACIPILQPILEMFKGRSIWSLDRESGSYQYNSHSKRSAQQQQQPRQDSIELRSKPRKKVDVYGFTMHAKEDSEESIVHPDKHSATSSSGRQSDTYPESEDKIVKSSTVTITYDQGEERPTSAATRWAAIRVKSEKKKSGRTEFKTLNLRAFRQSLASATALAPDIQPCFPKRSETAVFRSTPVTIQYRAKDSKEDVEPTAATSQENMRRGPAARPPSLR